MFGQNIFKIKKVFVEKLGFGPILTKKLYGIVVYTMLIRFYLFVGNMVKQVCAGFDIMKNTKPF